MHVADDQRWEPEPVTEEKFFSGEGDVNINRAPLDAVSGVVYKRSAATKSVRLAIPEPDAGAPHPWQGRGTAVLRWLFSEHPGTAEGLLVGRTFAFLQELTVTVGSSTAERAQPDVDVALIVVSGVARLYHRPTAGSPVITRPLRVGDAALVRAGERYSIAGEGEADDACLIVLGLQTTNHRITGGVDG